MNLEETWRQQRSKFVTRVARVFSIGSLVLFAVTLGQLYLLLRPIEPSPVRAVIERGAPLTAMVLAALLLLYAITLSVSVALLRRISWALPAFVGILGLGIALNFGRLAWSVLRERQPEMPDEGPAAFLFLVRAATLLDVAVPIGTIVVFGWLILRLSRESVRAEFSRG